MIFLNYAKYVPQHDMFTTLRLSLLSDILSFYKEELAGERSNFVHDRAVVTGQTVSEVLSGLLEEVVASVERARVLLKGAKEKETWERFITGYVAFHFYSPRYRLIDLTGSEYINADLIGYSPVSSASGHAAA